MLWNLFKKFYLLWLTVSVKYIVVTGQARCDLTLLVSLEFNKNKLPPKFAIALQITEIKNVLKLLFLYDDL